jgi:hypothetical protein
MTIELDFREEDRVVMRLLPPKPSQCQVIEAILKDRRPHSAYELARVIAEVKYGNSPRIEHGIRIGARIWDLNRRLTETGQCIVGKHDPENPQKYWYQLVDLKENT